MALPPVTLTKLREALLAQLSTGFPEHLWLSGLVEGPIEHRRPVGMVYPSGMREMDGNADLIEIDVRVRMFHPYRQKTDVLELYSPATLELWAETLPGVLGPITTLPDAALDGTTWYFRVSEVEFDLRAQGLEATLLAVGWNPFACYTPTTS